MQRSHDNLEQCAVFWALTHRAKSHKYSNSIYIAPLVSQIRIANASGNTSWPVVGQQRWGMGTRVNLVMGWQLSGMKTRVNSSPFGKVFHSLPEVSVSAYSHWEGNLFILLMVSSAGPQLLSLIESHLFILEVTSSALWKQTGKNEGAVGWGKFPRSIENSVLVSQLWPTGRRVTNAKILYYPWKYIPEYRA